MPPSERRTAGADGPALGVAAVARRLGVAPATLRTWARRYGLEPSAHQAGSHRLYTPEDLARLVVMRRLTLEGVPPVQAARSAAAMVVPSQEGHEALTVLRPEPGQAAGPGPDVATVTTWAASLPADRTPLTRRPSPAGRDALQQAALDSDVAACTALVAGACQERGPVAAWDQLVQPALRALGRRWEATGVGVDTEVLLQAAVLAALRDLPVPEPRTSAGVLLAAAEGESSSLPLHVLAAAVSLDGVRPWVLAPGLPREAVAVAVRRTGPVAVLLHADHPVRDAAQLAPLPRLRAPSRLVLSGPGWGGVHLPEGRAAQVAPTMEEARLLLAVATAPLPGR
jgi:MerR family transcriptional regulator, light-induced transcriptional regulator